MKEYINKLPKEVQGLIYLARDIACKNNITAYLVGGFVRDLLLGVENLDLDIVVEGNGIKFAENYASNLKAKLIPHRRFGTATITNVFSGIKIDIASARKENYPYPASLPLVSYGTLRDDLFRRDFSINAMAISINSKDFGKLIDLFGGRSDLAHRLIRILHNLSFIDDPTRILRAIRFEKRYGLKIEPTTFKRLKQAVRLKMLEKVQAQRIRDALILMLKEAHPLKGIRRLKELAGFTFISPHILLSEKTCRFLSSIERQITWFKRTYPELRPLDTWLIYFIGLTDSLKREELRRILRRFAFQRGEEKRILTHKKINSKFIAGLSKEKIKPSKVFEFLDPLSFEAILMLKAKYKNRNIKRQIESFLKDYNRVRICISGHDLHRLGLAPGPGYQKIFKKVLDAKLNGLVKTKEEEMVLLKKLAKSI